MHAFSKPATLALGTCEHGCSARLQAPGVAREAVPLVRGACSRAWCTTEPQQMTCAVERAARQAPPKRPCTPGRQGALLPPRRQIGCRQSARRESGRGCASTGPPSWSARSCPRPSSSTRRNGARSTWGGKCNRVVLSLTAASRRAWSAASMPGCCTSTTGNGRCVRDRSTCLKSASGIFQKDPRLAVPSTRVLCQWAH